MVREERKRDRGGRERKRGKKRKGLQTVLHINTSISYLFQSHVSIYLQFMPGMPLQKLLQNFTTLQKQVMRVTRIASVKAHRKSLLLDLDIVPFENINKLQVVMFMCMSHMQ